jgi:hypothetical protein
MRSRAQSIIPSRVPHGRVTVIGEETTIPKSKKGFRKIEPGDNAQKLYARAYGVNMRHAGPLVGTAEVPHIPDRIAAALNASPLCQEAEQGFHRSSGGWCFSGRVGRPRLRCWIADSSKREMGTSRSRVFHPGAMVVT